MWEEVVILFARCIGADIFKKYWPVNGSYWRKEHINKTSRVDLKKIISDAHDYNLQHIQQLAGQIILFTILWFLQDDVCSKNQYFQVTAGLTIMHCYTFVIQRYNIILARRALAALPAKEKEESEPKLEIQNGVLGHYLTINFMNISPYFMEEKAAHSFKNYLEKKYNTATQMAEAHFLDEIREDYIRWRKETTN